MTHILKLLLIAYVTGISKQLDLPEDAKLNVTQLANKYGQKTEAYDILSEDGYFVKVYRFVGNPTRPVLLIHGAVDSTDSFLLRGNTSLGAELTRNGYDVWSMNYRGNMHSRRHKKLNPDKDTAFWDFSMHEMAYYDLPPIIDLVLNMTGQEKVLAIGYSMGTTLAYMLGATRPEYNDKIKVFVSLAPICYVHNTGIALSTMISMSSVLNNVFKATGINEIVGFESPAKQFLNKLCVQKNIGYEICMQNLVFGLSGSNPSEVEPEFLPVIIHHFPTGTSWKTLHHLAQIGENRRFAMYDHGLIGNLNIYKSSLPPEYDLNKVTMKIALIVAKNDPVSTIKNAKLLHNKLPNVVAFKVMKPDLFNHMDFIWGRNTYKTLHPIILDILNKNQ